MMNAYRELLDYLEEDEKLEHIILGDTDLLYGMDHINIPKEYIDVVLTIEEAKPYLLNWEISGGFGAEEVAPFYAWTNKRVLFIGTYDGSTWLDSVPRRPIKLKPYTIGG